MHGEVMHWSFHYVNKVGLLLPNDLSFGGDQKLPFGYLKPNDLYQIDRKLK